jgi:hypothetical protein
VPANELSKRAIKQMAEEIGLTRLTDEHLEQLMRATATTHGLTSVVAAGTLTPADEPAHAYRVDDGASR